MLALDEPDVNVLLRIPAGEQGNNGLAGIMERRS